MSRRKHTPQFVEVRDRLLGLEDADRRPIGRLLGTMTDGQDALTPAALGLLRAIVALDDADVARFQRWSRSYVSRFGGVPNAASYRVDSGAYRGAANAASREPAGTDDGPES